MLLRPKASNAGYVIAGVVLAFCSGIGYSKTITLNVMAGGTMDAGTKRDYKELAEVFEKRHPGVKINWSDPAGVDAKEKLLAYMAGNVPLDIYLGDIHHVGYDVTVKCFRDLTPMWRQDKELQNSQSRMWPATIANTRFKGKIYAMPGLCYPFTLYANVDLMKRAGVGYPEDPWTWDEFIQVGRKLTKDDNGDGKIDQFACNLPGGASDVFPYVWQMGGDIYQWHSTEDYAVKCTMDQPEFYNAIEWVANWAYKYQIAPLLGQGGRVVISAAWSGSIPSMIKTTRYDWDIISRPVYKKGISAEEMLGVWTFGSIIKSSKHPKEAWELVKFLASEEAQIITAKNYGGSGSLGSLPRIQGSKFYNEWIQSTQKPKHKNILVNNGKKGRPAPYPIYGHTKMVDIYNSAVEKVLQGRGDSKQLCIEAAKQVNKIFKDGEKKGYYKLNW